MVGGLRRRGRGRGEDGLRKRHRRGGHDGGVETLRLCLRFDPRGVRGNAGVSACGARGLYGSRRFGDGRRRADAARRALPR